MNNYEQMKNQFLVELNKSMSIDADNLNLIASVLDIAASKYDVTSKANSQPENKSVIPVMLDTYLVVKKTEGLSEGTLDNYERTLKGFFTWVKKQPEEVTANDIRMYIYEYQKTHKITGRTLDKYREMICWFFGWAHMEEYIPKNPARAVKAIKHEVKERAALSQMELEYLRMACETKRDKAMLEFFYSTGCRVSELLIVKKDDIDWHADTVCLFGKGKKHRTSYINAKCKVALKEYLDHRDDDCPYLFVTERKPYRNCTKEAIERAIRVLGARSQVDKKVTPHMIRHTTATQATNNGMAIQDVSRLLGHANVATTMIYAKISQSKVHAEHQRCVI